MTSNMQNLLARVDGVADPVGECSILRAVPVPTSRRTSAASRRLRRIARERAGVQSGRLPRFLEALADVEVSEIREELAAAGLM